VVTTTTAVTSTVTASVLIAAAVFGSWTVAGVAHVALSITAFVSVKVIERFRSVLRQRAVIPVVGIIAIIDVAVPAMMAVIPGASSDEDSTDEPIGTIVAVRGAFIRGIVKVSVWADRSDSDVDGDLGWCDRGGARECCYESNENKRLAMGHFVLLFAAWLEAGWKEMSCFGVIIAGRFQVRGTSSRTSCSLTA
jgi:hypothetical protein